MLRFLVVIPHYGDDEHLVKCFESLKIEKPTEDEMKEVVFMRPFKYGEVFVSNNNLYNVGFTEASNVGIRYGLNNNFDIFWLLNNDTQVVDLEQAIKDLEEEFTRQGSTTGVAGFKILAMDDPDFIHHGGTGQSFPAGVHKIGRVSSDQLNERTLEKWVTGASMAISSGCLMETGLLDNKMVNYGSDSDFCYRARLAGFNVIYLPIPVLHKIGQSQNPKPEQVKVIKSDMLHFRDKWISGKLFFDLDSEVF